MQDPSIPSNSEPSGLSRSGSHGNSRPDTGWGVCEAGARNHASAPALLVLKSGCWAATLPSQAQSEVQKDLSGALLSSQGSEAESEA